MNTDENVTDLLTKPLGGLGLANQVCSDDIASCIPGVREYEWQYTGGD